MRADCGAKLREFRTLGACSLLHWGAKCPSRIGQLPGQQHLYHCSPLPPLYFSHFTAAQV
jgi:hypothetical protein